jgi:small conductance mechanosensitive channel
MFPRLRWLFVVIALHLLLPRLAWGADVSALTAPGALAVQGPPVPAPALAPIKVGPQQLFDVGSLPGQTAQQRAETVNRRIASFVRQPGRIAPVLITTYGGVRALSIEGRQILTVTEQDAADNLTTLPELAERWREALDEALGALRAEHQTFWSPIGGAIVRSTESLLRQVGSLVPRLAGLLLVLLLTRLAARGSRAAVGRVLQRPSADPNTRHLVQTFTYYGAWIVGWVVALGALGIDPSALVAGLGITTLALGFALKDILSNLVSGFLLLTTRPFRLGDQIAVKEFEGTVEQIELRATFLRTCDNRLVVIPNAELCTATVTNTTAAEFLRQEFVVSVACETNLDEAREVALRALVETEGVLAEPPPDVLVAGFGDNSIQLKLRFCTDSRRFPSLNVGSDVRQRVKEAFDAAGIGLPFPTRVLHLQESGPARLDEGAAGRGDWPRRQPLMGRRTFSRERRRRSGSPRSRAPGARPPSGG